MGRTEISQESDPVSPHPHSCCYLPAWIPRSPQGGPLGLGPVLPRGCHTTAEGRPNTMPDVPQHSHPASMPGTILIALNILTCFFHAIAYFTYEETGTEKVNDLPKLTQPGSGRTSIPTQEAWPQDASSQLYHIEWDPVRSTSWTPALGTSALSCPQSLATPPPWTSPSPDEEPVMAPMFVEAWTFSLPLEAFHSWPEPAFPKHPNALGCTLGCPDHHLCPGLHPGYSAGMPFLHPHSVSPSRALSLSSDAAHPLPTLLCTHPQGPELTSQRRRTPLGSSHSPGSGRLPDGSASSESLQPAAGKSCPSTTCGEREPVKAAGDQALSQPPIPCQVFSV